MKRFLIVVLICISLLDNYVRLFMHVLIGYVYRLWRSIYINSILKYVSTFKDNEEFRVSCPVPAEDGQTDCTSAQQLSMSPSPPCTAELSVLRYMFQCG